MACLASRVPYGSSITKKKLSRIQKAEELVREAYRVRGNLRVRDFGTTAKIEVDPRELRLFKDAVVLKEVLKKSGYKKIEVDPRGYRMGSLNEGLETARI
jgi:uncharacterized protein